MNKRALMTENEIALITNSGKLLEFSMFISFTFGTIIAIYFPNMNYIKTVINYYVILSFTYTVLKLKIPYIFERYFNARVINNGYATWYYESMFKAWPTIYSGMLSRYNEEWIKDNTAKPVDLQTELDKHSKRMNPNITQKNGRAGHKINKKNSKGRQL